MKIYIGADHDIRYSQAKLRTGPLNNGTCSYTFKDRDDTILDSGSLTYEAGSDGNYSGVIDRSITTGLISGATYYLEVTFSCQGAEDFRRDRYVAWYRQGNE